MAAFFLCKIDQNNKNGPFPGFAFGADNPWVTKNDIPIG
jgi:hypothetical protein